MRLPCLGGFGVFRVGEKGVKHHRFNIRRYDEFAQFLTRSAGFDDAFPPFPLQRHFVQSGPLKVGIVAVGEHGIVNGLYFRVGHRGYLLKEKETLAQFHFDLGIVVQGSRYIDMHIAFADGPAVDDGGNGQMRLRFPEQLQLVSGDYSAGNDGRRGDDRLDDAGGVFQFSGRQKPVQCANGCRRGQQRQGQQQVAPNRAGHITAAQISVLLPVPGSSFRPS